MGTRAALGPTAVRTYGATVGHHHQMIQPQLSFASTCLSSRFNSDFLGWVTCLALWPGYGVQWNWAVLQRVVERLIARKKREEAHKRPRESSTITGSSCLISLGICLNFQFKCLVYARLIIIFFFWQGMAYQISY